MSGERRPYLEEETGVVPVAIGDALDDLDAVSMLSTKPVRRCWPGSGQRRRAAPWLSNNGGHDHQAQTGDSQYMQDGEGIEEEPVHRPQAFLLTQILPVRLHFFMRPLLQQEAQPRRPLDWKRLVRDAYLHHKEEQEPESNAGDEKDAG